MEVVTSCTHEIVRDVHGEILVSNGNVLIKSKSDGTEFYVPISNEISEVFGYNILEEIKRQNAYNENNNSEQHLQWNRDSTLQLIHLYKKYEKEFHSTTVRNEAVYKKISNELMLQGYNYTSTQCTNKFKYLKMRYMKWKDSLKRSGAATITFDYKDEMEEIFGKKPNVIPLAIASSLGSNEMDEENTDSILEDDEGEPKRKKVKESKNAVAERRHKERLAMQQVAIDSFENTMAKLIDKL